MSIIYIFWFMHEWFYSLKSSYQNSPSILGAENHEDLFTFHPHSVCINKIVGVAWWLSCFLIQFKYMQVRSGEMDICVNVFLYTVCLKGSVCLYRTTSKASIPVLNGHKQLKAGRKACPVNEITLKWVWLSACLRKLQDNEYDAYGGLYPMLNRWHNDNRCQNLHLWQNHCGVMHATSSIQIFEPLTCMNLV